MLVFILISLLIIFLLVWYIGNKNPCLIWLLLTKLSCFLDNKATLIQPKVIEYLEKNGDKTKYFGYAFYLYEIKRWIYSKESQILRKQLDDKTREERERGIAQISNIIKIVATRKIKNKGK